MSTKIQIDLADLGWSYDPDGEPAGETTLRDLVIREAANMILTSEFRRSVQKKVEAIIDAEASEQVRSVVTEVVTGPIQRTTPWGERTGEPTSVREIVREKVEKFLTVAGRDGYGSRNKESLSGLIEEATSNILTGELRGTVKEAKEQIHQKVTQAALAAAVKELAR